MNEAKQTEMFPREQILARLERDKGLSDDGTYGVCTAARIKKFAPDVYKAAVAMLANCVPMKQIARELGMGMHTVMAISDIEQEVISGAKEKMSAALMTNARLANEKLRDALLRFDPKDADISTDTIYKLMLTMGIAVDKANLLGGGPTERIVVTDDRYDGDWRTFTAQFCRPVKVVEGTDKALPDDQSNPTDSAKSDT